MNWNMEYRTQQKRQNIASALEYIKFNPEVTTKEIAEFLGASKAATRKYVQELQLDGRIHKSGTVTVRAREVDAYSFGPKLVASKDCIDDDKDDWPVKRAPIPWIHGESKVYRMGREVVA